MVQGRVLLSVYDKTGLVELGAGLVAAGYQIIASGGTARQLQAAGLDVLTVEAVTQTAEFLQGRVKTLHPAIAGAILARRTAAQLAELAARGYAPIDIVVCNLYPFSQTIAKVGVTEADAIENIDIGGVTLLRAAAKNYESVTVLCDPNDYSMLLSSLVGQQLAVQDRRRLAHKAFAYTASYDASIASYFAAQDANDDELPQDIRFSSTRVQSMRYGENPHQQAAFYQLDNATVAYQQLQGKELSYNNLVDVDAAWQMPNEFSRPSIAIVKHTNPCGMACADDLVSAYGKALACDPVSAFGSVIAANKTVSLEVVKAIGKLFVEVLLAPDFAPEALEWLKKNKKNCRVLRMSPSNNRVPALKPVCGGFLLQTADTRGHARDSWTTVSKRQPSPTELEALAFAWLAVKHVKSNAIVFVQGEATVGIGAGQMNRVDSVFLAARHASEKAKGAVMGSDAFFPFADGVETAASAGVTACIQPGGSIRDDEVIAAVDRFNMSMIFTGERHFRH